VLLTPTADSAVPIDELRLDYLSDGTRTIRGVVTRTITTSDVVEEYFHYVVDAETATFKAVPALSEKRSSFEKEPASPPPNLPPGGGDGCCDSICSGYANAQVIARDPILIELAKTTAIGNWANVDVRLPVPGCKWTKSGSIACEPRNPTPILNTHWFTSTCQKIGPFSSPFYFQETATANYYNWDFLSNNLRTDITQTVTIEFDAPLFTMVWGHQDSGESAITIFGTAGYTIQDTCWMY
jgi:hypothetical protein